MDMVHELRCTTRPSSIPLVHDFIDHCLGALDPENAWLPDVHIIADELASNIEKFAYGSETGPYMIRLSVVMNFIMFDFEDRGMEFDPTQVILFPLNYDHDRPVGKLGILLARSLADRMEYFRRDERNVTTITIQFTDGSIQQRVKKDV